MYLYNIGKNISFLAASASRAAIHKSYAKHENLADITAKTGIHRLNSIYLVYIYILCACVYVSMHIICMYKNILVYVYKYISRYMYAFIHTVLN